MTATERKRLGKVWKMNDSKYQEKFPMYEKYYIEFKTEIDTELGAVI